MNRTFFIASSLVIAACWPLAASSQVIVCHIGANNPVMEGFSLNLRGDVQLGPAVSDLGLESWMIRSTSHDNGASYHAPIGVTDVEMALALGWRLSTTLRFVEISEFTLASASFQDGTRRFRMVFSVMGGKLAVAGDGFASHILEENPFDYHEYALIYDAASQRAALWINGIERVSDILGTPLSASASVGFGASGESITYSHWHEVTVAIIPEPAVVGVGLGLGALAGALVLRRRREKARGVWRDLFPLA